jgi:serine/threonine protein kinase
MMDAIKNEKKEIMDLKQPKDISIESEMKFEHQKNIIPQKSLLNTEIKNSSVVIENKIIGRLNNEFYLLKKIGKGSTGSVYLSYSIHDLNVQKKLYAIKIMQKKSQDDICINNCEVNFLEKMNHKNILKVYGHGIGLLETYFGLNQYVYYIVMDYLDHGSLLSQINNNIGFGEDYGRLILSQLLDGLEAIHDANIVHRDIKLDNIMISGDDYTLKYVDFGFATEKSNRYLNTFLGTPNYAAPELHLKREYLGVYEDIFSLGVTLFIIVTGHLPFILPLPNDPLYQYIFCVDYINYWRNRKIKVSPSFMELFDNLIAFDPAQRPSISEIRKSKWMQEINWNLLPSLKQEFLRREENLKQKTLLYKNQAIIKNNNNNNIKNINVNNPNNMKKGDDMVNKIMEEKKEEFINDMKKKLFLMNNQKEENIITNNLTKEHNIINNNIINNKEHKLQGFIKIKLCLKNLNSLIIILKQHLKNEGFNITKKDLDNLLIEISNGEVDILLTFEKMLKEIKINYIIINGNKDDFLNFKKIMKKLNITQV